MQNIYRKESKFNRIIWLQKYLLYSYFIHELADFESI